MTPYLGPWVESVTVGGESGDDARVCDYAWVLDIVASVSRRKYPSILNRRGPGS